MKIRFAIAAGALALAGCNDTSDLEARLQAVEDQLEIQRVITDYAAALDARDYDKYLGVFTEDGIWQNGDTVRNGRGEIREMLSGLFGEPDPDFVNLSSFHQSTNFEIDVDGDTAHAKSRFIFVMRGDGGSPTPALSGQYEDDLVRTEVGWKIAHRNDHTIMPTPEEWIAQVEAMGMNTLED